jgi:hypothetical protein
MDGLTRGAHHSRVRVLPHIKKLDLVRRLPGARHLSLPAPQTTPQSLNAYGVSIA